uniref:Uncharacterized protein n=1 Tax=Ficedula albicollis TaxID=59894 RepID=A0A803W5G4_FICAL
VVKSTSSRTSACAAAQHRARHPEPTYLYSPGTASKCPKFKVINIQCTPCSSRGLFSWLEADSPQETGQCRTTMRYHTLHPTRSLRKYRKQDFSKASHLHRDNIPVKI